MTALDLVAIKGRRFPRTWLMDTFGNRPVLVVKFGKLLGLDIYELSSVLRMTCPGVAIVAALTEAGQHSGSLQDYIVAVGYEYLISDESAEEKEEVYDEDIEGLFAELVEQAAVQVALTIDEISDALAGAMHLMPGKKARMAVKQLVKMNRRTGRIGMDEAVLNHPGAGRSLVIFDTSGSMGEDLVSRIVDEVAKLAVEADATLAIVSNTTAFWEPGTFNSLAVLQRAEFGGTHYETLEALFDQDWAVVVTVADYDSSWGAKEALSRCSGRIGTLLDISLVDRPTFLAECLVPLADEVKPLIVAAPTIDYAF